MQSQFSAHCLYKEKTQLKGRIRNIMEKIINTVSTIFKERYGTKLKIEKAQSIKRNQPVFLSHWQSPFVYSRTLRQVSFPIFNSKKELQAIATASPVENKDAIVFDEMAQFLQLTIAEHIEITNIHELQVEREKAFEKINSDSSKVIELKTKKKDTNTLTYEFKKPKITQPADLSPIWISGQNQDFNAHIAFSIHDWVSNWAFINAKEIPDLIWQDPNSWQNFSQVTIFIPNIETLSAENIAKLKENLQHLKRMQENKPLIVVSSASELSPELENLKSNFKHYKANKNISARVQAHFLLYHYKEDKPWTHQCDKTDSVYFLPFSNGPKQIH